ncbi:hypothetical protein [Kitasatospora sp. NPDC058190]|uniref:hypothetical protein n=1 Tax=Kitasatospora sp. NPDC058190 TaxID=3346371 RepID=UPI0036D8EFE4
MTPPPARGAHTDADSRPDRPATLWRQPIAEIDELTGPTPPYIKHYLQLIGD